MRYIARFAIAFAGMTAGLVAGVLKNGLSDTHETFMFGIAGGVLLPLLNSYMIWGTRGNLSQTVRRVEKRHVAPRKETQGSFEERMERFSANVNRTKSCGSKSTMPFWSDDAPDTHSRTPPKPISLIVAILRRIRKTLTGH